MLKFSEKKSNFKLNKAALKIEENGEKMTSITPELYEFIAKVVDDKVKEIKVTREEFDKLTSTVDKLAEAQRRTEERLERLVEAQLGTEKALSELASQVGGLSDTIGYGLEDIARVMVPGWFERHMNIIIEGELDSAYVHSDGKEVQVNLFGKGRRPDGKDVIIVGERKSRIQKREVKSFAKILETVKKAYTGKDVIAFMFSHLIHPSADEEAKEHDIIVLAPYRR